MADVDGVVRNVASSALASVISGMHVDDVLTVQRIAIQNQVMAVTQAQLNAYQAGVRVTAVSLEGVAPGTYGVALGVYDPGTLERLSIDDGSAASPSDGRLVLGGETITVEQSGP